MKVPGMVDDMSRVSVFHIELYNRISNYNNRY